VRGNGCNEKGKIINEVVDLGWIFFSLGWIEHVQAYFETSNATVIIRENDIQHFVLNEYCVSTVGEYYPPWIKKLSDHQKQAQYSK